MLLRDEGFVEFKYRPPNMDFVCAFAMPAELRSLALLPCLSFIVAFFPTKIFSVANVFHAI